MRLTFRASHRLTHARQFRAVYDAKLRKTIGVLTMFSKPNGLPHHRLGLAVGTPVGNAVVRGHAKRLIRESFRLDQHTLARIGDEGATAMGGMDLVVRVRPGAFPDLEACREAFRELVTQCCAEWERRQSRERRREE